MNKNVSFIYINIHIYTYIHIYTHTHNEIISPKEKNILPFATMWIDLEGNMPNGISQKTNNVCHHLNAEPRK